MGELIDALVRVLEFVVQGALAVLLGGYILAWVHKFKNWVYEHVRELTLYMFGPNWREWKILHPNVLIAMLLGGLYLAGVVTNAVGYWLLKPAHEKVIAASKPTNSGGSRTPAASALVRAVVERLAGQASEPDDTDYTNYIQDEIAWRNQNLTAMQHALDPLLKQGRVIRGTAVIALGFLVISVLKAVSFLVCLVLLIVPGKVRNAGRLLYRNLVYPKDSDIHDDPVRRATAGKYAVSNIIYAAVAFIVLWCAMGAYATLEREYHVMAYYGPRTVSIGTSK